MTSTSVGALLHRWKIGELGFWLWRCGRLDALPDTAADPFGMHARGELRAAARAWLEVGCPYEAAEALADSDMENDLREGP